jgi:Tfp pilus assembly protein PilE
MGAQLPVEPQPAATPTSRVFRFFLWGFCALILLAIVIPLYANVGGGATLAKAQADVQSLASAVEQYKAHMGVPPATLTDLTSQATNARGQTAGPYVGSIPAPSPRFSNYRYERHADGRWSITTSGKDSCGRAQKVEATAGSPSFQNRFVNCPGWRRLFFSDGN